MEKVRLKDIGTIVTGNTPSKKKSEYYINKDICFFKPSDIEDYGVIKLKKSEEYISEKARNKVRMLPENSVLVTCIGTIGKVGIIEKEACCNQQINAIIPNNNINSKYLAYAILSKKYWLQKKANAPVVPIINKSDFSNVEIFIHNIEEQNVIVNQLDKVQEIIDLRKKQIEELDKFIKSQFVEMFGDNKYPLKKLEELTDKITDGSHNPPTGVEKDTGFVMLSSQNIINNRINYDNARFLKKEDFEKENKRTNLKMGDVLLTIVGTIGRTAIITDKNNITLQRSVAVIKPKKDINSIYLVGAINSDNIIRQLERGTKGVAQKGIYLNDLKKILIEVPPIELQNQFAEFVKQIDKQKFVLLKTIKMLKEYIAVIKIRIFLNINKKHNRRYIK